MGQHSHSGTHFIYSVFLSMDCSFNAHPHQAKCTGGPEEILAALNNRETLDVIIASIQPNSHLMQVYGH